jgi:hypothetical protein
MGMVWGARVRRGGGFSRESNKTTTISLSYDAGWKSPCGREQVDLAAGTFCDMRQMIPHKWMIKSNAIYLGTNNALSSVPLILAHHSIKAVHRLSPFTYAFGSSRFALFIWVENWWDWPENHFNVAHRWNAQTQAGRWNLQNHWPLCRWCWFENGVFLDKQIGGDNYSRVVTRLVTRLQACLHTLMLSLTFVR